MSCGYEGGICPDPEVFRAGLLVVTLSELFTGSAYKTLKTQSCGTIEQIESQTRSHVSFSEMSKKTQTTNPNNRLFVH